MKKKSLKALYASMMIGIMSMSCYLVCPAQEAGAAVFYLYPEVGIYVPTSSGLDTTATLGLIGGVGLFDFLVLELEYQRRFERDATPSGNLFNAAAALRIPVGKIVPYGSVGVGFVHTEWLGSDKVDFLMPFGAGVDFGPWGIFSAGLGVEYGYIENRSDYVLPYLRLGLIF